MPSGLRAYTIQHVSKCFKGQAWNFNNWTSASVLLNVTDFLDQHSSWQLWLTQNHRSLVFNLKNAIQYSKNINFQQTGGFTYLSFSIEPSCWKPKASSTCWRSKSMNQTLPEPTKTRMKRTASTFQPRRISENLMTSWTRKKATDIVVFEIVRGRGVIRSKVKPVTSRMEGSSFNSFY